MCYYKYIYYIQRPFCPQTFLSLSNHAHTWSEPEIDIHRILLFSAYNAQLTIVIAPPALGATGNEHTREVTPQSDGGGGNPWKRLGWKWLTNVHHLSPRFSSHLIWSKYSTHVWDLYLISKLRHATAVTAPLYFRNSFSPLQRTAHMHIKQSIQCDAHAHTSYNKLELDHAHLPDTSDGLFCWIVFPMPNCPSLLSPQHLTLPSAMRAHVCISPPVGDNVCVCVFACDFLPSYLTWLHYPPLHSVTVSVYGFNSCHLRRIKRSFVALPRAV